MAPTINYFTLLSPFTAVTLNSALITLCMFTHMGVHEIFESSVVYIQSKWGSPLIAAVTTTSVCLCVFMHGSNAAYKSEVVRMWAAFYEDPCTTCIDSDVNYSSRSFSCTVAVNTTAFLLLVKNKKWFITTMKRIDGIYELLTFMCLPAQWMSSKVNCVKLLLICSERHGKDVDS